MPPILSAEERERYDRQILIAEIGLRGQEALRRARVAICGAGGLGSPAAIYLAAAGVGAITLIDRDRVALSNLNRQVLHGEADIGRLKIDSARDKLGRLNPHLALSTSAEPITAENAVARLAGHDVIIDALDNLETRYIVNRAALELMLPFIHGAVNGFEGRALTVLPGKSACLRCLSRGPVAELGTFPVIGVTPGVIGVLQATEAIKLITGIGTPLAGRLVVYDGLHARWREFMVERNPGCAHCGPTPERRNP